MLDALVNESDELAHIRELYQYILACLELPKLKLLINTSIIGGKSVIFFMITCHHSDTGRTEYPRSRDS